MTQKASFRRVALALQVKKEGEGELLTLPRLPRDEGRATVLASFVRELFTRPGGGLEARAGAVLLDHHDRPRGLTAPFGHEWPRADVQALELFTTAKKAGLPRLVLFRLDPNPHTLPDIALQFAQEMRALGLLFAVEVVDLLIIKPRRHWILSKVPILGACLDCEATLNRAFNHLIARGFERSLPPIEIPQSTEEGVPLSVERLTEGPFAGHGLEGA